MALRKEAMRVAEQLCPNGFRFNDLELHGESEMWIATFIDDSEPPHVVIERFHDYYTEGDPEPTDTEGTTDGNESPDAVQRPSGGNTDTGRRPEGMESPVPNPGS